MSNIEQAAAPEKSVDRVDNNSEKGNSDLSQSLWQLMETSKSVPFQMADQQAFGSAIALTGDLGVGSSQSIPSMELFDSKAKSANDAIEQKSLNPQDAKADLTESLFSPNLSAQEKLTAAKTLAEMGVTNITGPDGKEYNIRTQNTGDNTQVGIFGKGEDGKQHPFLRGIVDSEGNVRQQVDSTGRPVAFEGSYAKLNSPDNALINNKDQEKSGLQTKDVSLDTTSRAISSTPELQDKSADKQSADPVLKAMRALFATVSESRVQSTGETTSTVASEVAPATSGSVERSIPATAPAVETAAAVSTEAETKPAVTIAESTATTPVVAEEPAKVTEATTTAQTVEAQPAASQSSLADLAGLGDIEKAAQAPVPAETAEHKALNNLDTTEGRLVGQTIKFEDNVQNQGFMGKTFDFLKNNVGSSSEGRAWYNPKALWSNLLDSDSGSDAIRTKLDGMQNMISSARTDLNTGNIESSNQKVDSVYTQGQDGTRVLQAANEAQKYDDSQRNGVEFMSDAAVTVGTVALASTGVGAGVILGGALVGGGLKYALKSADGNYASSSDLLTGAMLGAAPGVGRLAGAFMSEAATSVGTRVGSAALTRFASVAGIAMESGTIGGMTNASQTFSEATAHGASTTEALSKSATSFGVGFGIGFAGGAIMGGAMQMLGKGSVNAAMTEAKAVGSTAETGGFVPRSREAIIKDILSSPDPSGKVLDKTTQGKLFRELTEGTVKAEKAIATTLQLDKAGYLPEGIHNASWDTLTKSFGGNDQRAKMLHGMLDGLHDLKEAGVKDVFLGGSFVTKKGVPGDFDIVFNVKNGQFDKMLDKLSVLTSKHEMKSVYGGEFIPNGHNNKMLDILKTTRDDRAVGLVKIDLNSLPARPTFANAAEREIQKNSHKVNIIPGLKWTHEM